MYSTKTIRKVSGFTLIELLVVISIIALLSSIVLASLGSVRAKTRDTKRKVEVQQIYAALQMWYSENGSFPPNPVSGSAVNSAHASWPTIFQPLVDRGMLTEIPRGPNKNDYSYYNYGPNNTRGALIVTTLEDAELSLGYPATCRPFTLTNWCRSDLLSRQYCLCHLH